MKLLRANIKLTTLRLLGLLCTGALSIHVWSTVPMSRGGSTHTALLNRVESKIFRIINSPPLTDCLDSLSYRCNVASFINFLSVHIFMLTALLNLLTACLHPSHGLTAQDTSHPYSVHLSNAKFNQYFHSFIPYTGKLWNSLHMPVLPSVYDLNSFKRGVSRYLSY